VEVPRSVAVASIAMVQQDISLYAISVRDKLCLWRPDVSEDQIWSACADAQLI